LDLFYTARIAHAQQLQTFRNSFSSSALTESMTASDWRHLSLKMWNMRGDWSASTRMHVAIRSTSSSVIGWQQRHTHNCTKL